MKQYWQRNVRSLLLILFVTGGLLLAIAAWFGSGSAKIIGFYAGAGLLGCIVLIVIALLLGKMIQRKDTYYDP